MENVGGRERDKWNDGAQGERAGQAGDGSRWQTAGHPGRDFWRLSEGSHAGATGFVSQKALGKWRAVSRRPRSFDELCPFLGRGCVSGGGTAAT